MIRLTSLIVVRRARICEIRNEAILFPGETGGPAKFSNGSLIKNKIRSRCLLLWWVEFNYRSLFVV
jgi:hypothetical protein